MMRKLLLLLTLAIITLTCTATEKDKCSSFDHCKAKPRVRTCSCAEDCAVYGTCCKSLAKHHNNTDNDAFNTDNRKSFYCYSQRTVHPIFAKRSCADDYRGHPGTSDACLDTDVDNMDVGNNHIVTSHVSKVTYWNRHCAICNHEKEEDLERWNIVVICPAGKGLDAVMVRKNLTYVEDAQKWGLNLDGIFVECSVKYAPSYYVGEVRHCTPNLISNCPGDYEDKVTVSKCSKYYGERRRKNSDNYYKNVHCAICNGVDLKELECSGMTRKEDFADETDFKNAIEVEFTKGRWLDFEEGKRFECSKGFLYNPFWKRCRRHVFKELPLPMVDVNSASKETLPFLWLITVLMIVTH